MHKRLKKGISIMLVMAMVGMLGMLVPGGGKVYAADGFALGTGTVSNPYQIATAVELNNVRNHLEAGKNFKLTADIDLSGYATNENGAGWLPIGDDSTPFQGTIDGNGYKIKGLTIYRPSDQLIGLFGEIDNNASITKMKLEDVSVTGGIQVGGLVAVNGGTINSSYATGNVSGYSNIGGLVGGNDSGGTINSSYATVSVS
ncbi:S-layer protein, partial [Paenibacillus sp. TAF58]